MTDNELKAIAVGNDKKLLRKRLMETRSVLNSYYKPLFKNVKFSFEEKRLYGENGYYIQWRVRDFPDEPISYENQQTNCGRTTLERIKQ